jgi:orotate phosphoribosyltransferase
MGELEPYKQEFIEFMVRAGVLTFGDFVLKSGRRSPYFVNTGRYRTGAQLDRLAGYYATALERELGDSFEVLFGPAYKGIPLAVSVATALARRGHDVGFCFDRKEAKDHGEGGRLVGHPLADGDRVVIVEDVTTAGTSVRDTVPLLRAAADITLAGLVVSVDRRERGTGERSALAELREAYGMPAFAIVTIEEVIAHLHGREIDGRVPLDDAVQARMLAYLREHGGRS